MKYESGHILAEQLGITLTPENSARLTAQLDANYRMLTLLDAMEVGHGLPALRPMWAQTDDGTECHRKTTNGGNDVSRRSEPETREVSPTEAVEAALRAIEAEGDAHVFTHVFAEEAINEARRLEQLSRRERSALPLWGHTVAVKDMMSMRGYAMTGGSRALRESVSVRDAVAVERLRRAGAVIIGAANLHELAFGTTSDNPHFGRVANPVDRTRLAGGSSGGSAAAIGFNMATMGLGTDTGGSIRIPASCCGLVGFKPSFDLVSRDGVFPFGYTLDHVGPLTKTVGDAALMMDALVGVVGTYSQLQGKSLKQVRIGVPRHHFFGAASPQVLHAYESALQKARAEGAQLVTVDMPQHTLAPAIYLATSGPEAAAVHQETMAKRYDGLGGDVLVRLLAATVIPAATYVRAQQARRGLWEELKAVFKKVDVIATPTIPVTTPTTSTSTAETQYGTLPIGAVLTQLTSAFNLTGVPALSIPCGTDNENVPIGLQLVGPFGDDGLVLSVGRALERMLS